LSFHDDIFGSDAGILDVRSAVPFECERLVPVEDYILLAILSKVRILDRTNGDRLDIRIREGLSLRLDDGFGAGESLFYKLFEEYNRPLSGRHCPFFELDKSVECMK